MDSAKAELVFASDCCPVGCSIDVFLVKSRRDGQIYSYCWACGVMWRHPLGARWGDTAGDALDPRAHLPEGFGLPTDAEITTAGFSEYVLFNRQDDYCQKYFETELNVPKKY
jgi:hypothetical protein